MTWKVLLFRDQRCLNVTVAHVCVVSFDREKLARFVLQVRKFHRPVPYHNFKHGFMAAHSMCIMLKHLPVGLHGRIPGVWVGSSDYSSLELLVNLFNRVSKCF